METKISLFALADTSIVEDKTLKTTLVGVFNYYHFRSFPAKIPVFLCYIRLIGFDRANEIVVKLLDLTGNEIPGAQTKYENVVTDPATKTVNIATYYTNVEIPSIGKYPFKVLVDGNELEPLPEQYIEVRLTK